jgi:hypothetical protein
MESHLREQELAQYVDALATDQQDRVPQEILEHVQECFACKVEVMEVLELKEAVGPSERNLICSLIQKFQRSRGGAVREVR